MAAALRVQKVHVHVAIALVLQQGYTDDENHEKLWKDMKKWTKMNSDEPQKNHGGK